MHFWGDNWKHWDDMGEMTLMASEVFKPMPTWPLKEKFGTLRYNLLESEVDADVYREGYRKLLEAFPHLTAEIMFDATHHELLIGLVDEETCEHLYWTTHESGSEPYEWCGVCGKGIKSIDK